MRTGCLVAAMVIATGACGSSAAAPTTSSAGTPARASACGPRAARTLALDAHARIYVAANHVYGCAGAVGRPYLLGQNPATRPGQDRIGPVALAGVDAGYSVSQMGVDTISTQVLVRRLDTGRTLHDATATTHPLGPEFFQSVDALVVKPDGGVAWIATGNSIVRHGEEIEVDRVDSRGEARLDTGSGIDTGSLRLRGSRLTWRDRGALRTATLL